MHAAYRFAHQASALVPPLQPQRHENTIRVVHVITERPAEGEANALVEGLGGLEAWHGAGLQAQAGVRPGPGHVNDVGEDGPPGAVATQRGVIEQRMDGRAGEVVDFNVHGLVFREVRLAIHDSIVTLLHRAHHFRRSALPLHVSISSMARRTTGHDLGELS